MKREGRQHGMVRTYRILPDPLNPRPETRFSNRFDSPVTAGMFARVSTRPTNHSKFTGKCGQARCNGCHFSPACKAKDKSKGSHKNRSNDVVSNFRLVTWRVVDPRPGLNFSGVSAARILDQLYDDDHQDDDDYDDDDGEEREEEKDRTVDIVQRDVESTAEIVGGVAADEEEIIKEMGFCDVGFVVEQLEGDDGWCLVGEM